MNLFVTRQVPEAMGDDLATVVRIRPEQHDDSHGRHLHSEI